MTDWFVEAGRNDTSNIYQIFRFVNNSAEGLFFPVIILVIWMVTFIVMLFSGNFSRPSASKGWIVASFIASVLSALLVVIDLMSSTWMYVSFVLTGIGAIWLILENATG